MTMPRWLDRALDWAVGIAFVVMVPIWLIEWSQDLGVANVLLIVVALFLIGVWRAWPVTD